MKEQPPYNLKTLSLTMPRAGIAERLHYLAQGLYIREKLNIETLTIYWGKERQCNASFDELFSPLNNTHVENNKSNEKVGYTIITTSKQESEEATQLIKEICRNNYKPLEEKDKLNIQKNENNEGTKICLDFYCNAVVERIGKQYLTKLNPIKEIQEKIEDISTKKEISEKTIGVSLRLAEISKKGEEVVNNIKKVITDGINQLLEENNKNRFLLITDSQKMEDEFISIFGDKIITTDLKKPEQINTTERCKEDVVKDIIELLLLSKTNYNQKIPLKENKNWFTKIPLYLNNTEIQEAIIPTDKNYKNEVTTYSKSETIQDVVREIKVFRPMEKSTLNLFPKTPVVEYLVSAIVNPKEGLCLSENFEPTKNSLMQYIWSNKNQKKAWIRCEGLVLEKEILEREKDAYLYIDKLKDKDIEVLPENCIYVNLLNHGGYAFAHMLDHLKKIKSIPKEYLSHPIVFLLSDPNEIVEMDVWVKILASDMNHSLHIFKKEDDRLYKCKNLIDIKMSADPIQFSSLEEFNWVTSCFEKFFNKDSNLLTSGSPSKKVFLTRTPPLKRHIKNYNELHEALIKEGVEILTGKESLEHTYNTIKNATHICGLHGGLFKHTMFANKDSNILEYIPHNRKVLCFARQYNNSKNYCTKTIEGDKNHDSVLPIEDILLFYKIKKEDIIPITMIGSTQAQKLLEILAEKDVKILPTFIPYSQENKQSLKKEDIPKDGIVLSDIEKIEPNVITIKIQNIPNWSGDIDLLKSTDKIINKILNDNLNTNIEYDIAKYLHINGRFKIMADELYKTFINTLPIVVVVGAEAPNIHNQEKNIEMKEQIKNPEASAPTTILDVVKKEEKVRLLITGECHAKPLLKNKEVANILSKDFEIVDISYGEGRIDRVLETLDMFTFKENDVFLLGGTVQEHWGNELTFQKKLEKLTNTIFTQYKNSKIVFWNAAVREDHGTFEKVKSITKAKEAIANNKNIFTQTMESYIEDFADATHYSPSGLQSFIDQIKNYVQSITPLLKMPRFEKLIPSEKMVFPKNEGVIFILEYKEKIMSEIFVEYHNGISSSLKHHYGVNLVPDRKHILKLKDLKSITFPENIATTHCQIQYY